MKYKYWSVLIVIFFSLLPRLAWAGREVTFDRPGEEEDLNEQLWEQAKKGNYQKIKKYIQQQQARSFHPSTMILPSGWAIGPAGKQIEVGRLPYEAIWYQEKLVVINSGFYGKDPQEVSIVNTQNSKIEQTLKFPSLFPSAAVGLDGDLYISGGNERKIYRLNQQFKTIQSYDLGGYGGAIAALDKTHLAITYLDSSDDRNLVILNTATGKIEKQSQKLYFPHDITKLNNKLYVTVLGENKVAIYDTSLKLLKTLAVGKSPRTTCSDGHLLYVVNSSSDSLSVIDTKQDILLKPIDLRYRDFRFGSAPTSCAVDGDRLYVSLAQLNAVAIVEKSTGKRLGFIPTGWYPTKVLHQENQIAILSAKGIHPRRPNTNSQYVLSLLQGSLSLIAKTEIAPNLAQWSQQVENGSPIYSPLKGFKLPINHVFYIIKENRTYDQVLGDLGRGNGDPKLTIFGQNVTPNHHQIARDFVTLDNYYADGEISVLGHSYTTSGYASPFLQWLGNIVYTGRYSSYPFGIVPATYSPNYLWNTLEDRKLDYKIYGEPYYFFTRAYQIILDNYGADSLLARKFYANSMVLAKGNDRGKSFGDKLKPYYGQATTPQAALTLLEKPQFRHILSVIFTGDSTLEDALGTDPLLREKFAHYLSHFPLNYHYWDLGYSDLQRFQEWKIDFNRQLQSKNVAALHYIWLPNDHTAGTNPKYPNAKQLLAQNDAALGEIIKTISHSPIWANSLILVTEDDAQNGPDHVDATRTVGLAAGPYVRRGSIVSDSYDQLSMLRTIGLVLGLDPLNLNDALAVPMFNIFTKQANFSPYNPPSPSLDLMESDRKLLEQK